MKYGRFPTPCDFSPLTISEAALQVGPSFVYTLRVGAGAGAQITAHNLIRQHLTSEFPVHFNIEVDATFKPFEWCLEANGKAFGSEGI